MNINNLKIAIIGATGVVGSTAIQILEEREHPKENIFPLASKRSEGKKIQYLDKNLIIKEINHNSFDSIDVAIFAAGGSVSEKFVDIAISKGVFVIDKGSVFRRDPKIPLIVPEVNAEDILWHPGVVSTPNCTTTPLVMIIDALRGISNITAAKVSTYQAVTGTGLLAKNELFEQSKNFLENKKIKPEVYPHQIAFNVLPHIDEFLENGYTGEEDKMLFETRKILHDEKINISATCVRVPVFTSHSESILFKFEKEVSLEEINSVVSDYPGMRLFDDVKNNVYPMPIFAADTDDVLVGRIRKDIFDENTISLYLSCDNLRKGAALNGIQIMDYANKNNILKPVSERE
ncbi:MAG: aspartate-semialdehyde dehydrogenase [Dehalococcoidia bacterium]